LERLAWTDAERALAPEALIVLPIGAALKEHGPHLPLRTDWLLAEALAERVLREAEVVLLPTLAWHHYPAFAEYPGSVSLRAETARDVVVDIARSLARHGPRRFYALNTGFSTMEPLAMAADALARERVLLRFTDMPAALATASKGIAQQAQGTHADEVETSMLLHLAPGDMEMARAVRDGEPRGAGPLTRDPAGKGIYSPSGVFGDATLATAEKGARIFDALVRTVLVDLGVLRTAAVP
jgi:creatinine amidohydrolase